MKFIIDTDIGDDIDDAFALDFALKKSFDLVCITTVFRNTVERAQIVRKMLSLFGKAVPVYAGYGNTICGNIPVNGRLCQWTDDLCNYTPDGIGPESAVDGIVNAARRYGKELTVLAIGPLTNIARAIQKDPNAMKGISGIVMMGGDYRNHYAEWNIRCDVAAADVVFSSEVPIVAFGHELTSLTKLTREQQNYVMGMEQDDYHAYLAELSRLWAASKPEGWLMVMHDVLVVRYADNPEFCRIRTAPVAVETQGKYTCGMTTDLSLMDYHPGDGRNIGIATEVSIPDFLADFMHGIGYSAFCRKLYETNRLQDCRLRR